MAKKLLKVELFENALHFLQVAIEQIQVPETGKPNADVDQWKVKNAILGICTSIELLLKYCLYRNHWSLIFEDVDKANLQVLKNAQRINLSNVKSNRILTVSYEKVLERVQNICGVKISSEHLNTLTLIRALRNQIEHFAIEVGLNEAYTIVLKSLEFVIWFVDKNLGIDLDEHKKEKAIFLQLKRIVYKHEDYMKNRMEELSPKLDEFLLAGYPLALCHKCLTTSIPVLGADAKCYFCDEVFKDFFRIITCPQCGKFSLPFHFGELYCANCNSSVSKNQLRDFFRPTNREISQGANEGYYVCPCCSSEDLFHDQDKEGLGIWFCLTCGEVWDDENLEICSSCGDPYEPGEYPMCPECWHDMLNRND